MVPLQQQDAKKKEEQPDAQLQSWHLKLETGSGNIIETQGACLLGGHSLPGPGFQIRPRDRGAIPAISSKPMAPFRGKICLSVTRFRFTMRPIFDHHKRRVQCAF